MTRPKETVHLDLAGRSYDIIIGAGLLAEAGNHLRRLLARPRLVIVTDEHVARLHLAELSASLKKSGIASESIVLPAGETTKSFEQLASLCDRLLAAGVERSDVIAAFGGGVIGDLVGFTAAILRRGVPFVQLPTTLLAQVDSSIGGKTGINSPLGKNLIGAFHQPAAVIADISLLSTLPQREFRAGYAEVVKYALLGDRDFYHWLDRNLDELIEGGPAARLTAVKTCCQAKARIVAADETEMGARALINLGHTFGHALEAAAGYSSKLLHGEAVAVGMAMAFRFSAKLGFCPPTDAEHAMLHMKRAGLPASLRDIAISRPKPDDLLKIMQQDKKARAGRLTFILVRGIGQAFIARDVEEQSILSFLASELHES
jgi:3-dehydroquinate synthase